MFDLIIAGALSAGCLAVLRATGQLWFLTDEIDGRGRQLVGLVLLWAILLATVFYPTVSPGNAAEVDPKTLWFPSIFLGHVLLTGFLLAWWLLARPQSPRRFLVLDRPFRADDVRLGLTIGAVGWVAALATSAIVALVLQSLGLMDLAGEKGTPFQVPPLLLWMIDLPLAYKLLVVLVAMTVEEAFYRAFLQTRLGWVTSSVLFALSHAGYGLPTLMASVFTISLAIGWGLRRTGSLVPSIVAHGFFDGVQLLVIMPLAVDHLRHVT